MHQFSTEQTYIISSSLPQYLEARFVRFAVRQGGESVAIFRAEHWFHRYGVEIQDVHEEFLSLAPRLVGQNWEDFTQDSFAVNIVRLLPEHRQAEIIEPGMYEEWGFGCIHLTDPRSYLPR